MLQPQTMFRVGSSHWSCVRAASRATQHCHQSIPRTCPPLCKAQIRLQSNRSHKVFPWRTRLLPHGFSREKSRVGFPPARRRFSISVPVAHGHLDPPKPGEELHVTIVDQQGKEHTYEVAEGDNLLDIAQANDLDMEGACGGSCACATCHVIFEDTEKYEELGEPSDDEEDMLGLAFGLTETSRLGCQVQMTPPLDGLRVKLPLITRNVKESDFKKKT